MSRMYGIHFRAAIEGGLDQGRWVGQYLNALRTRRQPVRRLSWGLALAALNLAERKISGSRLRHCSQNLWFISVT